VDDDADAVFDRALRLLVDGAQVQLARGVRG
jgi:hypothetical protein